MKNYYTRQTVWYMNVYLLKLYIALGQYLFVMSRYIVGTQAVNLHPLTNLMCYVNTFVAHFYIV